MKHKALKSGLNYLSVENRGNKIIIFIEHDGPKWWGISVLLTKTQIKSLIRTLQEMLDGQVK